MASEEKDHQEPSTHHSSPAGGIISVQHVESSTKATEEIPPHNEPSEITTTMAPKPEEAPEQIITHSPEQPQGQQQLQQHVSPPLLVVRETGPSHSSKGTEDGGDSGSVVSMPAAVPSSAADQAADNSSSPLATPPDADAVSVASAPAVVVDVDGGIGNAEMDDIMASPHGKYAIVERSPGGRYVRFMEKLGSGASKDVYRAYDTQEGIEVAWNVVHLAGVPKNERNRIVNEVRLLERLHHHNIISFHGSWVNREKQQVNFVTEILSSGTLQSFINKVQVIRWKIAKRWALQILKGLEYLHSQDPPVIHRDLKCENIFINGTSGDLRIGDLGLSTVHRNGKALSVLGTPEFMAPDMYEESAYDEKVDIYAFGMCLLEIFTKEIPYRECNNPAQIYKKVTRGDPPDSLKRLKSRHARDFINMCLGTKDEEGNYMRPSATELIAHPFLQQRPSDDDEVEVEPPMNERTIKEVPETSSGGAKGTSKTTRSLTTKPVETTKSSASSSPRNKLNPSPSQSSLTEDESDRFDEMPDSEMSFRKPKVLMGRGQELQRDESNVPVQRHERTGSGGGDGEMEGQAGQQGATSAQAAPKQQSASAPSQSPNSAFHFLVAAAVIEDEYAPSRPYDDDVLKLVVTLPVEGQTQNVQFDFHLVQDDPIQVAKEMVAELGIPQAAVLEISETISGLARAARIKQDKYMARMNKPTLHARSRSESRGSFASQGVGSEGMHSQTIGHAPNMMQSQSQQSMSDYMGGQPMQGQHGAQQAHQQQGVAPQDQAHLHGQQMAQHTAMPQMHLQPQHQVGGESLSSLPLNAQLQNHSVGQQMTHGDQTIHTAPAHLGHGQHQQQNWNPHQGQNNGPVAAPPPSDTLRNAGQQPNYGNAPIVRSISGNGHADSLGTGPNYGQAPMQHVQMPNQQQGQNLGSDGQGAYNQAPMQHSQAPNQQGVGHITVQPNQTQVRGGGQQGVDGQGPYNQVQMQHQHAQVSNQQQAHNGGPQGIDGQGTYNQVQMHQHAQVPNQQQGQSGGQQGVEGQRAYNQAQMQHSQVSNQQQGQNGGQQGVDGQSAYNQSQMHHSQQTLSGGHQGVDGQGAYNQAQIQQHAQAPNQQQSHGTGQHGVDGQGGYNQGQMQQQVPNHQQAQNGAQQQGVDGQGTYNQVQMQQHAQLPNQQQAQTGGQQGLDGQSIYSQATLQQHQVPNQQQPQGGGNQGVDGQGAYNQVQMQHAQPPNQQQQTQSGGQQGMEGQGQGPTAFEYMHNPQNQGMEQQDHVSQNGIQGPSGQVPAPAPYAHQSQSQTSLHSMGMQMQGNPDHSTGGYQAPQQNESAGQSQFVQGSTHGMQQHSMQQNSNQQMHMMPQSGQNQAYGQTMAQQLQQQQPQQQLASNQAQVQQHLGAHQVPGPALTQQPVPSAGPSNQSANADAISNAPIQMSTDPAVADDAAVKNRPSASFLRQSSSVSDDQVVSMDNHMNGVLGVPSTEIDDGSSLADEELAAELRKLDEDFQKHMMRTQKVFDTRMDSLQRTQVQREALHQKTLEKHQKERADFEKRRQQEEIEQNRRIEQLQKDWVRRREAMRQQQLAEAQAAESSSALSSSPPASSGVDGSDGGSAQG